MTVKLLGETWDRLPTGSTSPQGPVNAYVNDEIGTFLLTPAAARELNADDSHKILSAIYQTGLVDKNLLICTEGETVTQMGPELKPMTLSEILIGFPTTLAEKEAAILVSLYQTNSSIGESIPISKFRPYMFFSETAAEMGFLLDQMNSKGFISLKVNWSSDDQPHFSLPMKIQEQGWNALEQTMLRQNSKSVFVAMWFDPAMEGAYQAIANELVQLGFRAMRIDKKQHNNEISGEILFEIRRCRFLIADVTRQRHGVYFEAGYAMGLGIPVIWTCQASDLSNVHFDTRQYNHVVWDNENDLRLKISDRVKGTILK